MWLFHRLFGRKTRAGDQTSRLGRPTDNPRMAEQIARPNREEVARLSTSKPPDPLATLQEALTNPYSVTVRTYGDRLVTDLIELIQRNDVGPEVKRNAVIALGRTGSAQAVPHVVKVLEDESYSLRKAALEALAKDLWWRGSLHTEVLSALRQKRDAVLVLLRYVEREGNFSSSEPFESVAEILAALGEEQAIPLLLKHLTDPYVADCAAKALAQLGWQPHSVDAQIRLAIVNHDAATLRSLRQQAEDLVINWLHEGEKVDCVWALGILGTPKAQAELMSILKSGTHRAKDARDALNPGRPRAEEFVLCPNCYAFLGTRGQLLGAAREIGPDERQEYTRRGVLLLADRTSQCASCGAHVLL